MKINCKYCKRQITKGFRCNTLDCMEFHLVIRNKEIDEFVYYESINIQKEALAFKKGYHNINYVLFGSKERSSYSGGRTSAFISGMLNSDTGTETYELEFNEEEDNIVRNVLRIVTMEEFNKRKSLKEKIKTFFKCIFLEYTIINVRLVTFGISGNIPYQIIKNRRDFHFKE